MNGNMSRVSFGLSVPLVTWIFVLQTLAAEDSKTPVNRLPNASFEEQTDQGVKGWTSRAWSHAEHCQWRVASSGRTGTYCLSIRSEAGTDAAWSTTVSLQPNTFYRLSGWIKTENVRGAVGALLNIQNMQQVRTPPVTGTNGWTQIATIFRTGETTEVEVNCLFGGWGESTGQAWYDDVAIEPLADVSQHPLQAVLTIDTDATTTPYSPMIFGGFIEHFYDQIYGGLFEPGSPLSNEQGFRKDVIEALKELKLSIVRWPGGCFASGYHWQDGVGPTRQPVADPVWGTEDPNTFGTDEFVAWCRQVGCQPYICTNAGNGTPDEMRDWVQYCNGADGPSARMRIANQHPQPLNVRYWSIGNENWGGHEIGSANAGTMGPVGVGVSSEDVGRRSGSEPDGRGHAGSELDVAAASDRRIPAAVCGDSRVLAALLGRESHAGLPCLYHAVHGTRDDHPTRDRTARSSRLPRPYQDRV